MTFKISKIKSTINVTITVSRFSDLDSFKRKAKSCGVEVLDAHEISVGWFFKKYSVDLHGYADNLIQFAKS